MANGLDDVIAAETVISEVNGRVGRLILRGLPLNDLVESHSFEQAAERMLDGFLPGIKTSRSDLKPLLGNARSDMFAYFRNRLPGGQAHPVDALRTCVAQLPDGDDLNTALNLIAAPAVLLPMLLRQAKGLAPIAPDPEAPHAVDMLHMLTNTDIDQPNEQALETYLMTVMDHGLNASTFTARVVASTGAGLTSSVLAGLSALKGPLHGGAPGPVLDMLDAIITPENAEPWLQEKLDRGERLMGFGHRIYRVRDPRADALKLAISKLPGKSGRLALAEAVEKTALRLLAKKKPDRPLKTNVEFYTAVLLEALGFPPESFTGVFFAGRVVGWIAHAREQAQTGRLIRPQSLYVGPRPQDAA